MPDFPCIFKTTVNFSVKRMAVKVPFRSYLISVHRLWKILIPSRLTQTRYARQKGECPMKVTVKSTSLISIGMPEDG